jgi:hypothetical protein
MTDTAGLWVSRATIKSFRCIGEVTLDLEPQTTILVGENNSGQSSIMLALATALGSRHGTTDDLRRDASGVPAKLAIVDIFISPERGTTSFSAEIGQRLGLVQRDPASGNEIVGIRTSLHPSGEGAFLVKRHRFLQPSRETWVESAATYQPQALALIEAHLLDASRDLVGEMGNVTSSWGRVLSDLKIPELPNLEGGGLDPRGRLGLEGDLRTIAERLGVLQSES